MTSKHNFETKIKIFADRIERQKEVWVEKHIIPHMQKLLNKAQSRLKTKISFFSGMGTYFFSVANRSSYLDGRLTNAVASPYHQGENPTITRIRDRFPELVEFCDIVCWLSDKLDYAMDDMVPTESERKPS